MAQLMDCFSDSLQPGADAGTTRAEQEEWLQWRIEEVALKDDELRIRAGGIDFLPLRFKRSWKSLSKKIFERAKELEGHTVLGFKSARIELVSDE